MISTELRLARQRGRRDRAGPREVDARLAQGRTGQLTTIEVRPFDGPPPLIKSARRHMPAITIDFSPAPRPRRPFVERKSSLNSPCKIRQA
jgi:hypothetical protein